MKNFLKRLTPVACSVIAVTAPAFVSADLEMRLAKLESQTKESLTGNARGTYGAKLADASPNVDGWGFYFSAGPIYYQMYQDNNSYAIVANETANGIIPGQRTVGKSVFDWRWGVKAGLGYYFEHDFWQTGFEFTYLNSKTDSSITAPTGKVVYIPEHLSQLGFTNAAPYIYSDSNDQWDVTYYNLDWRIGKDFFVSKYLSFLAEFGVKSAWLYQNRTTTWIQTQTTNNWVLNFSDDYLGVGPKADIVAKLWLGRNWSLTAMADWALLWAQNDTSYTGVIYDSADDAAAISNSMTKNHLSPYMGMNIGLAYDTNFNDDLFNFGIKASYDLLWYYNANRMMALDIPSDNDVYMQGVSLTFLFAF